MAQCPPYYERPLEWKDEAKYAKFVSDAMAVFEGKKIFLDAGHGGEDRRSIGNLGMVVEADANLRVVLYLRDFLSQCRAEVVCSRTADETVSLADRSKMANESCADIFVSVHHNHPGNTEESINYTSTYYHALESDYEYEPMERDLARFVQRDLSYAMRNSGGTGSFDGTYSDYFIYPNRGFAVLRHTNIPAILVECGFFSNINEERRLSLPEFNKVQAFGILKGLYRYFKSGVPKISVYDHSCREREVTIYYSVEDTSGIDPNSINVYSNGVKTSSYWYDPLNARIAVTVAYDYLNQKTIRIVLKNNRDKFSYPFEHAFQFANDR